MDQEDLNGIMVFPWECKSSRKDMIPQCPKCGERYCGDGKILCIECEPMSQHARSKSDEIKRIR